MKRAAAEAAIAHVAGGEVLGVGTGSTVNFFIEALAPLREKIPGAVASSSATAERLQEIGIPLVDLNGTDGLGLYVDSADEATLRRELIKGGGGALTREKIIAAASERFVGIVDETKLVERLGAFPLPVEVIPISCRQVVREIAGLGGRAELRRGFTTDNGNVILDVHDLDLTEPRAVEGELNQIAGLVTNGLFCRRPADLLLVAAPSGVREI